MNTTSLATIRQALEAVNCIIENTYEHDENGCSAADIVEQVCNVELNVAEAIAAVEDLETQETPAAHTFTLIGHYTNTGLTYLGHFDAETPEAAIQQLADFYPDESISIAAVIEGRHNSVMDGDYIEDTDNYRGENRFDSIDNATGESRR